MDVKFYCGVNETKWNYHPVRPGRYVCVAPVMGSTTKSRQENRVFIPDDVEEVIVDSGAFCDGLGYRLSFHDALERQHHHIEKYNYGSKVTHLASYDLLIDEKWSLDGVRKKERWDVEDACYAVDETIRSAEYISNHRNGYGLILSSQGVSTDQYVECTKEITKFLKPGDIFGLGGWCILGLKRNKLRQSFREIITESLPLVRNSGVTKVHIWGMMYVPALGELLWVCDRLGLLLSLDSSGPQKRPVFGTWGYADWKDKSYSQPTTDIRGLERARHVQEVIAWLSNFRKTKWYQSPDDEREWKIKDD